MKKSTDAPAAEDEAEPVNLVLKENMTRLAGGRSVQGLRAEMAQRGLAIGTGTLHRALQGKSGNVSSLGKIAEFFNVTADQLLQADLGASATWPFSMSLKQRIAQLSEQKILSLEVAMWTHLEEEAPVDVQARLRQARARLEQLTDTVEGVEEVTPRGKAIRKV